VDDSEIQHLDDLESTHFWYRARKIQLSRWFSGQGLNLRVLDLGSATGGNTIHISSMGHEVLSAEYSRIGVQIQRNKGIPVIKADARNLPFPESTFDIVICLDVLEHIVEHDLVAAEIFRVLKPGGKFLISVPEDPKLWSAHDIAANHVRRYSKASLFEVIQSSGLKSLNTWSTLFLLRPAVILSRRSSKGSSFGRLNSAINFLLFQICRVELFLPRNKMKGVTIWMDGIK
jgi:SAM-dependent methyltransferase